jgi:dTDP-4-amino-4,6-dideoxygalactose transaminase
MVRFVAEKRYSHHEVMTLLELSRGENKFTNDGPVKRMLEDEISRILRLPDEKRVVCLGNGTAALHALLYAYEDAAGRSLRWLTPSFTFPTPVVGGFSATVGDVDETSFLARRESLEDVDGVIITTPFGANASVQYWSDRCKSEGKICIFDNASSPCSLVGDTSIMCYGNASFSSLHHTKYMGVGEGGFVVVEREMAEAINRVACFGFDADRNYRARSSNFKMSDISAAYILSHIRNYDFKSHSEAQDEIVRFVVSQGLEVLGRGEGVVHGNLPVIFKRKTEKARFASSCVEVNKYYRPLSPDRDAWQIYDRIINFPLHDRIGEDELSRIKSAIRGEVEDAKR